ncbi:SMARCA4 (predicted), partial [Pycnogonum litorale]
QVAQLRCVVHGPVVCCCFRMEDQQQMMSLQQNNVSRNGGQPSPSPGMNAGGQHSPLPGTPQGVTSPHMSQGPPSNNPQPGRTPPPTVSTPGCMPGSVPSPSVLSPNPHPQNMPSAQPGPISSPAPGPSPGPQMQNLGGPMGPPHMPHNMGPPQQMLPPHPQHHHGGVMSPHGSGSYVGPPPSNQNISADGPHMQGQDQHQGYGSPYGGPNMMGAPPIPQQGIPPQQQGMPSGHHQQVMPPGMPQQGMPPVMPQQQSMPPGPPQQPNMPMTGSQQQGMAPGPMQHQGMQQGPPHQQSMPPGPPQHQNMQQGPLQQGMSQQQKPSGNFNPTQIQQLRAQIIAYRLLARNQSIPENITAALHGKRPLQPPYQRPYDNSSMHMRPQGGTQSMANQQVPPPPPIAQQHPQQLPPPGGQQQIPAGTGVMGPPGPVNVQPVNGPATAPQSNLPQGMPGSQQRPVQPQQQTNQQQVPAVMQIQQQKQNRVTPVAKPQGIDPIAILQERENRVSSRIALRIQELSKLPANMPDDLRMKATIELKALRLLNFQRQLRNEVVACMRRDTTLETAINPKTYKRSKKQGVREARITERLEKQQKLEQERKRRQKHQDYLNAILQHGKDFKEYHRNMTGKIGKLNKAIVTYHANTER